MRKQKLLPLSTLGLDGYHPVIDFWRPSSLESTLLSRSAKFCIGISGLADTLNSNPNWFPTAWRKGSTSPENSEPIIMNRVHPKIGLTTQQKSVCREEKKETKWLTMQWSTMEHSDTDLLRHLSIFRLRGWRKMLTSLWVPYQGEKILRFFFFFKKFLSTGN